MRIYPLTNFDIEIEARRLKIKNWRGVFMRDEFPANPHNNECGVFNLDTNRGTHWVCYNKKEGILRYFDSFGLPPPVELLNYIGKPEGFSLEYNTFQLQKNEPICGHLCLAVLKQLSNGEDFLTVLLSLR